MSFSFNPFDTSCQYTDTLLQLEIRARSIQKDDLTADLLTHRLRAKTLPLRPLGHLVLKVFCKLEKRDNENQGRIHQKLVGDIYNNE